MSCRLTALAVDAEDPARLARFWAELLGRESVEDARGQQLRASETQLGLRFVATGAATTSELNRIHLHLTSASPADQQHTVTRALQLGASHLDVGQLPEEGHVVLADPEGYAFCVIEPGNAFLAGCGFLGELTCDGPRSVGLFWAQALGWPLVWDQDQETAIQSPRGGTKVSWGGEPAASERARGRQRLDLAVLDGDLAGEIERLVALGASRLSTTDGDAVELADPDGNVFCVRVEP
ncbi:VOC family protein [Cellulomonas sp. McL0617]|uniref:VOC family protein n=1 Tax=Cellulomonas sp. McL0617 TaxID=3415675 RepID=UPI003CE6716E